MEQLEKKFEERILLIRRVSKKTPGGNAISFSVLAVAGDKNGKVGIGLGSAKEVPAAIKKAINKAVKKMVTVPMKGKTIPHSVEVKYKAARLLLKPAPEGTGLKVGSVARVILDLAGVENASGKVQGSRNHIANSYAMMKALSKLRIK